MPHDSTVFHYLPYVNLDLELDDEIGALYFDEDGLEHEVSSKCISDIWHIIETYELKEFTFSIEGLISYIYGYGDDRWEKIKEKWTNVVQKQHHSNRLAMLQQFMQLEMDEYYEEV